MPPADGTLKARLAALGIEIRALEARGLRRHREATSLRVAEVGADGREHRLAPAAAQAWRAMRASAQRDGVAIFIVSAFRGIERQVEIVRRKLESGQSLEQILTVSAPPGYSEHHTGRAVDVGTVGVTPLEVEFERSAAFGWLRERAAEFGYRLSYPRGNADGYQYEPWHWCHHAARRARR